MGWLYASPPHRGRGVDSGGERRRRPLLTQFTTPKQCPDQQRQILARRHHARFLQRGSLSKRQQRQAVECGNGRAAQEARGPQVTAFCPPLRERRRRPLHNVVNVVTNLHPKYSSQVNGVSFSADGSLVASCSGDYRGDFSVRMWSVETGQELKKFLGHRCVVSGCCSPFSASPRRSCCSRASCR